jgi:hypothetical protein
MLRGQNAYAERAACPLFTAIAVIEGRWKPMVLSGGAGLGIYLRCYRMPGINAFTRRRYSGYCSGKVSIINLSSTRLLSQ